MPPTIRAVLLCVVVATAAAAGEAASAAPSPNYTIFQITTSTLPDAEPGLPYSASIDTVLGAAPLTWVYFVGNYGTQCDDPALLGLTLDTPSPGTSTLLHGDIPSGATAGVVTFCIGASSTVSGATPIQTITMRVRNTQAPQPPSAVQIVAVEGRRVTARWSAPRDGPAPESYRFEGGPAPDLMVAGLDIPATEPFETFDLPPGQWYLRATTSTAAGMSGPSPVSQIALGSNAFPSAPTALAVVVAGRRVTLSWTPSLDAGPLEGAVLDVTGSLNGLLGVPATDGWTIDDVPPGTYSVAVRGRNVAGTGAASAPVAVVVPGACGGPPLVPDRLMAVLRRGLVHVLWEPPTGGPAVEQYVVKVTGTTFGTFPVGLKRVHAVTLPPGSYTFSVTPTNACGAGPTTADVTVTVP